MNRICVYCGSRTSSQPIFGESADQLGHEIAKRTWGVVFGGGKIGMMGRVAEAALAQNGEVIGIIPTALTGNAYFFDLCAVLKKINLVSLGI